MKKQFQTALLVLAGLLLACDEPSPNSPLDTEGVYNETYDGHYRGYLSSPTLTGTFTIKVCKGRVTGNLYGKIDSVKLLKANVYWSEVRDNGKIEFHAQDVDAMLTHKLVGNFEKDWNRRWTVKNGKWVGTFSYPFGYAGAREVNLNGNFHAAPKSRTGRATSCT